MNTTSLHTNKTNFVPLSYQEHSDSIVVLGEKELKIDDVVDVARHQTQVRLTEDTNTWQRINKSCDYISNAVENAQPIYGVTSGFGGMANVVVSPRQATELQNNLVLYHKVGAGRKLSLEDVRAAMLVRMKSHLHGASGIREQLIRRMEIFLNAGVTPQVYELGSIGASGDLTPLSYITGALIGLNCNYKVDFNGEEMDAPAALEKLGLSPLQLLPKEGLAMMNGTSVM